MILIDVDKIEIDEECTFSGKGIKAFLNAIPAAYDVDKVVERLEERLEFIRGEQRIDDIKNNGDWTPEQGMRSGMIKAYLEALEIVKFGGIK